MCTRTLHLINLELLYRERQLVLRIEVHDKNEPKEPTSTTKILILLLSRRPGKIHLRLRVFLFPDLSWINSCLAGLAGLATD